LPAFNFHTTLAGMLGATLIGHQVIQMRQPRDKRLTVAKELKVGRFVLKIDGNGPVFAGLAGSASHGPPSGHQVS
jgi:hypothetical protein